MEEKRTTPEDVVSAVGALIVDMTDNGYDSEELILTIDAYARLVTVVYGVGKAMQQEGGASWTS